MDDRLYTVLLVDRSDGSPHELAFLVPSSEVAKRHLYNDRGDAGYVFNFRLDPLADKMRPYAVPTKDLAAAILNRLGREASPLGGEESVCERQILASPPGTEG